MQQSVLASNARILTKSVKGYTGPWFYGFPGAELWNQKAPLSVAEISIHKTMTWNIRSDIILFHSHSTKDHRIPLEGWMAATFPGQPAAQDMWLRFNCTQKTAKKSGLVMTDPV